MSSRLTKGKKRMEDDKKILEATELLRRVRHAVTQSPDKWNPQMQETVNKVFTQHGYLKAAYGISQNFKHRYAYRNTSVSSLEIRNDLYKWYMQTRQVAEFDGVRKMIRKHETEILNFLYMA